MANPNVTRGHDGASLGTDKVIQKRRRTRATKTRHKSAIDVTALIEYLDLMIRVADKLAEQQPYPDGIRKLRDAAKQELDAAWATMVRAGAV